MNDMPWSLLGLEPTDDLRAIKRAYARLLKRIDAETDPDGFQQLRGAYEHACYLASVFERDDADQDEHDAPPPPHPAQAAPAEAVAAEAMPSTLAASPLADDVALLVAELGEADGDKAIARLNRLLGQAHCTLPGMRQALAEAVLHGCASASSPSVAFLEHAARTFHWLDPVETSEAVQGALRSVKAHWAAQQATRIAELFQPTQIGPGIKLLEQLQRSDWMQELGTRDHFQLTLMRALLDHETPLCNLDKIVELLQWSDDVRHLQLLDPGVVYGFRQHYHARRSVAESESFETGLRQLAQENTRASPDVWSRRKAARQVLAPFSPWRARLASVTKDVQDYARHFVGEIDARYPVLAERLDTRTLAFWRDEHPHFTQAPGFILTFPGVVLAIVLYTIAESHLPPSTLTTVSMLLLWATLTGLFPLALTFCCQIWLRMRPRLERINYALSLRLLPSAWHGLLDHGFSTLSWLLWSSLWGLLMVVISGFFLPDEGWTWSAAYHALLWALVPGALLLTKAVVSWKWRTQWFPPKQYAPRQATLTRGWNWASTFWVFIGIQMVLRIVRALVE
ncbi:hypothetical protein GCM10007860_23020 [Chitiniphilus shinanonensis]|uniref:J domain-containing protein n=1 Tax=Chitiniphilus shinanonensis TaxID=553088 RepID=A0ABQ6BY52_9NEIS|nr:J domain-containing protein [Chitiniphilus shinanonensis]GLS05152.1 hypothetical protein GCM10007860_23020 [Chitiniphilus shinanonensis]